MSWTRRGVLGGGLGLAAALALPRRARAAGAARNVVVWWNAGGWDPTFVFDPHEGSGVISTDPGATTREDGGISYADAPSRPSVRELFGRYGSQAVVVNGIAVDSISHEACTRLLLTGGRGEGPDLPAIVGAGAPDLPLPGVVVSGPSYPGELGAAVTRLTDLVGDILAGDAPAGPGLDPAAEARVQAYLAGVSAEGGPRVRQYGAALAQLTVLQEQAAAIQALSPSDPETAAVSLLRDGLSRAVLLQPVLPERTVWDSHFDNQGNQERALEASFAQLLALLDRLAETAGPAGGSLLDETLVLSLSEMGRTPVLNQSQGKDHWPYTSALLLGAGLRGGRVLGGTDAALVGRRVDLDTGLPADGGSRLTSAALLAGVLALLGEDLSPWIAGVSPLRAL